MMINALKQPWKTVKRKDIFKSLKMNTSHPDPPEGGEGTRNQLRLTKM
jgi:hypothetical protein